MHGKYGVLYRSAGSYGVLYEVRLCMENMVSFVGVQGIVVSCAFGPKERMLPMSVYWYDAFTFFPYGKTWEYMVSM